MKVIKLFVITLSCMSGLVLKQGAQGRKRLTQQLMASHAHWKSKSFVLMCLRQSQLLDVDNPLKQSTGEISL